MSVVVATMQGWSQVADLVASLRPDAERLNAEVLVVDASGREAPPMSALGHNIQWMARNEQSVLNAVATGLRAAEGEVVAITEDHARPRSGWMDAILQSHAAHPEAAAIGGPIENGSTSTLVEWAAYFNHQARHMIPLGDRRVATTTNEANISYKRAAAQSFDDNNGRGFVAIFHNKRLHENGAILRVDDRFVVDHFDVGGLGDTTTLHFHNGRTISGVHRLDGMRREDWVRMAVSLVLPAWRTLRTVHIVFAKRRLRRLVISALPTALWLEYAQGLGSLVGYLTGPGNSPSHLR